MTLRIIRKYPNRRLYDPKSSAYITLADLRALVDAGEPFAVHDARTDADLTHSVLLQLLLEGEVDGNGVLDRTTLIHLIRAQRAGPGDVQSAALVSLPIAATQEFISPVTVHAPTLRNEAVLVRETELPCLPSSMAGV